MENLIILLHVLIAVAIIAFVLLQQGKGAEAGASFGAGASQTLFGSAGSWNFFSRVTAILALLFFLTSLGLALIAKNRAGSADALTPELRILEENSQRSAVEIPEGPADVPEVPEVPDVPEDASAGSGPPATSSEAPAAGPSGNAPVVDEGSTKR